MIKHPRRILALIATWLALTAICAALHLAGASRAALALGAGGVLLMDWLWRAQSVGQAARPVVVKRRKGKRRKPGVDRNGWPREIKL